MKNNRLRLSSLPKTWIFDIDGTLLKHNGYLNGKDELLGGVKDFFDQIPSEDFILLLTAREKSAEKELKAFLDIHGLRYNQILFGIPFGERILVNDSKPSGLLTAYAINKPRDAALDIVVTIDETI